MLSHRRKCQVLKRLTYLFMILLMLSGCSTKKEEVISSDLIQDEESFGSDMATYGDLIEKKVFNAERAYPISSTVTAEHEGLIFDKICVETNQQVKKGDLLVSIQPVTDQVIANKEASIAKNKDDYDKSMSNYESQIQGIKTQMEVSSGVDLQILQLQLEKLQKQYNWYIEDGKKTQEEMKQDLETLKSIKGDVNIYAPYDGVIDSVSSIGQGTELTTDRELLRMHSEEQVLLSVSDAGSLRYQMKVTVQCGSGENKKEYSGTVISADNVRTDGLKDGSAYVRLDEQVNPDTLKSIVVTANVVELHHVLVVKSFAMSSEKNNNFITIVDGDKFMKRHVVPGKTTSDKTWILQGVQEGQTVSIQ